MPKIILVPTSHIARESLENVRKAVEKHKPGCIALELDINRYYALRAQEGGSSLGMIKAFGVFAFLIYWIMKRFQKYFGEKTGVLPGSEMLKGIEVARESGIPYAFIDQPIGITFHRIRKIPLSEKLGLLWLLVKAVFGLAYPFGKRVEIDLSKVPPKELIDQAMDQFRKELPGFYRILVEERNKVMARNLKALARKFEKIVCVIGAGHEKGMKKLLAQ
jgi:pheromone shutdown-related protein TraB